MGPLLYMSVLFNDVFYSTLLCLLVSDRRDTCQKHHICLSSFAKFQAWFYANMDYLHVRRNYSVGKGQTNFLLHSKDYGKQVA